MPEPPDLDENPSIPSATTPYTDPNEQRPPTPQHTLWKDPPLALTVDEVADLLRVNRKTIYDAIKRGELPGVRRIGGTIRISRKAVISWLETGQGHTSRNRSSR